MLLRNFKIQKLFRFSNLVLREQSEKIGIITLNNEKKRNPLSLEALNELSQHLEYFRGSDHTKVIIIKAKGPVFSAGHDLKEVIAKNEVDVAKIFELLGNICITLRNLSQPVIAQVEGLATAGGCQLALACDLITATKKAQFATPGLKVGLFCTTPGVELIRSMPSTKRALEMLLISEPISAEQALAWGLINHIYEESEVQTKTLEFANKIASFSAPSIGLGKRVFYEQLNQTDPSEAYRVACKGMVDNLKLEDTQEGINAFIQKRHAHFKN